METIDRSGAGGSEATRGRVVTTVRTDVAAPASGGAAIAGTAASSTAGFLAVVGERVRHQRSLVHMSRRRLAERSGVSERYLAQLETGRGNMSIALLRKVALALELPLADLVAEHATGDPSRGGPPDRGDGPSLRSS